MGGSGHGWTIVPGFGKVRRASVMDCGSAERGHIADIVWPRGARVDELV